MAAATTRKARARTEREESMTGMGKPASPVEINGEAVIAVIGHSDRGFVDAGTELELIKDVFDPKPERVFPPPIPNHGGVHVARRYFPIGAIVEPALSPPRILPEQRCVLQQPALHLVPAQGRPR